MKQDMSTLAQRADARKRFGWQCPQCGNHNWPNKPKCYFSGPPKSCGGVRPEDYQPPPKRMSIAARIRKAWDAIEEMDPDISTEQLAARVADEVGCDYGDVFDAIGGEQE